MNRSPSNASGRVLVTGGSGFLGRNLLERMYLCGIPARASVRRPVESGGRWETVLVGHCDGSTDWSAALQGIDAVVHCAARVHVLREASASPAAEFRRTNLDGTRNLAEQAARAGVRRFVFVSTIGVNGSATTDHAFRADDEPDPNGDYARSKYEAERALLALSRESSLEVAIVRPPLIYGHNAPGNFEQLARWVRRSVPLPLASVSNRRSFAAIENVTDLLVKCTVHPRAVNQVFLVSDGTDISTAEFIQAMARAAHVPCRLMPIPLALMSLLAGLAGRREQLEKLTASLQLDISKTREQLDWRPPVALDQAMANAMRSTG